DDALREALDHGRLADPRLTDEHGVVLGAPREHLDDATDLLVAADHGVELALARDLGEVHAVLLERLVGALGVGARDARRAAHGRQRGRERVTRGARGLQSLGGGVRDGRVAAPAGLGRDILGATLICRLERGYAR